MVVGLRRALSTRFPHYLLSHRRAVQRQMVLKPLNYDAGPLVWIDCEMTGLNPRKDKILEIAVIITNGNLQLVDDGVEFVVKTDKCVLDQMGEWCSKQHKLSGLTEACLKSEFTQAHVANAVLNYIKKWIPTPGIGVMAGNSVHADRAFLVEHMPEVVDWLHYRIVDVSSIKELCRRWYPTLSNNSRPIEQELKPEIAHRAFGDILCSIRELMWYRANIFVPPIVSPESMIRTEKAPTVKALAAETLIKSEK